MKLTVRLLAAACLVALAGFTALAEEPAGKTIDMKLGKAVAPAAATDFATALGLNLESLKTLGARIDHARAEADPVCLAGLARELAAAEEVAGKKATLTGAELTKQAQEMAKYRNRPEELRTVAKILGGDGSEELTAQAEKTARAIERRGKDKESAKAKGITDTLHVDNHTPYYVRVSVNYVYRGTVAPYGDLYIDVSDPPFHTTVLQATAPAIGTFEPKYISQPVATFTWRLYE
jgi:hypothetical protein